MEDIKIEINIPNDNDGFILLKCDLCGSFFKLRPNDIQDDGVVQIWCPSCGLISENYLTEDVINLSLKLMKNLYVNSIHKEMKRMEKKLNSKYMSFKVDKKPKEEAEIPLVAGIEVLEIQRYKCCKKEAKIKPLVKICGSYCPYCGVIYDEIE